MVSSLSLGAPIGLGRPCPALASSIQLVSGPLTRSVMDCSNAVGRASRRSGGRLLFHGAALIVGGIPSVSGSSGSGNSRDIRRIGGGPSPVSSSSGGGEERRPPLRRRRAQPYFNACGQGGPLRRWTSGHFLIHRSWSNRWCGGGGGTGRFGSGGPRRVSSGLARWVPITCGLFEDALPEGVDALSRLRGLYGQFPV